MDYDNLTCEYCGSTDSSVEETLCPFASEIRDEEVEIVVCSECYRQLKEDI